MLEHSEKISDKYILVCLTCVDAQNEKAALNSAEWAAEPETLKKKSTAREENAPSADHVIEFHFPITEPNSISANIYWRGDARLPA